MITRRRNHKGNCLAAFFILMAGFIALASCVGQTVTFTTAQDVTGSHTVDVNDLSATFTVKPAPVPARAQEPMRVELPWWQELNIVSLAWEERWFYEYEMDSLVNVIGLGFSAEYHGRDIWSQPHVKQHQARGRRYVGSISTYNPLYETYAERPELMEAVVLSIYGEPFIVEWESTPEEPLWWLNTNHPVYQEFLLEQARTLVDAGADGIMIDEMDGTAGAVVSGRGSFGEPDMSLFREYLAEVYTPQELLDQFGIDDIGAFDYGDYIHGLGLAETWMNEPWSVPLYYDFERFQNLAIVEFMTRLISETKSYARTTYGREVAFTANLWGLVSSLLLFADLLDYYTVEYPYVDYGYPPESQATPDYKLARALGDKSAFTLLSIATVADLVGRDSSSTLMSIYIAEAYASQGVMLVPHGIYGYSEAVGPCSYSGDMAVLTPVYRFVHDNPFLYTELHSLAQTAVLYSFSSDLHRWDYRSAFRGLNYALLDGQVQFDIVALGDDSWLADSFSAASLAPYSLVFLPRAACLSNAQVDSLLSFVAQGGTLVAWGDTGIYDETGQETERPELAPLTTPGTHTYGEGRFIYLPGDPGDDYRQYHDPGVRDELVSPVNDYANRTTTTSAERTLNLLAYKRMDGLQMVVHFINYDYSIDTDQVSPTGSFSVTLEPPSDLLTRGDIQVYLLSPDREAPLLLGFAVNEGLLAIDHPGVAVYDVLTVMSEANAHALASEILDIIPERIAQANARGYDTSLLDDLLSQIDDAETAGNHLLARELGLAALELLDILMRPRILFDEAHGEPNTLSWERALELLPDHPEWRSFEQMVVTLEDDFIFERNVDAPLTIELLQDYQALILSAPREELDPDEIESITQFIESGGGLLVLGLCGSLADTVSSLISAYDITFDPHCVFAPIPERQEGQFLIDAFFDHPAVSGVPTWLPSWGGSLVVGDSAVVLAVTGEDAWQDADWSNEYEEGEEGPFAFAAAYEAGRARVVVVASNAFEDGGFYWRGSDLLMRSLLNWLTAESTDQDTQAPSGSPVFAVTELIVSPTEVETGDTVTVSVLVTNTGDLTGSHKVTLEIDSAAVAAEDVILAGGDSQTVTFTIAKDVTGVYSVTIDALSGAFTVKAAPESLVAEEEEEEEEAPSVTSTTPQPVAPTPAKPTNWPVLGGLVGGAVVVVTLLVYFLVLRRRST